MLNLFPPMERSQCNDCPRVGQGRVARRSSNCCPMVAWWLASGCWGFLEGPMLGFSRVQVLNFLWRIQSYNLRLPALVGHDRPWRSLASRGQGGRRFDGLSELSRHAQVGQAKTKSRAKIQNNSYKNIIIIWVLKNWVLPRLI